MYTPLLCNDSLIFIESTALTYLQIREWYDVGIDWSVPDCLLASRIIVVEAGRLFVKQFPPLITVLRFAVDNKHTSATCLLPTDPVGQFTFWISLSLSLTSGLRSKISQKVQLFFVWTQ